MQALRLFFFFAFYALVFLLNHISFVFCVAAVAQNVWRVSVLEKFWRQWYNVLQSRHVEKDRGQKADQLAQHGSQRLVFSHWRHCIFDYTVTQTFTFTFKLRDEMKYVNESIMICSVAVFLISHLDVSMCSQKAKREKAAMHHRQLYLLVGGVLVHNVVFDVLLYSFLFSFFLFLFICYGLIFLHSVWV